MMPNATACGKFSKARNAGEVQIMSGIGLIFESKPTLNFFVWESVAFLHSLAAFIDQAEEFQFVQHSQVFFDLGVTFG